MLHEKIRSVAAVLNEHKDKVAPGDGETWKILHNAAAGLEALADSAQSLEAHFVPREEVSQ